MKLIKAYSEYLKSNREKSSVPALVSALNSNGLFLEAEVLGLYYANDCEQTELVKTTGVFTNHRIIISEKPPVDSKNGIIWFDPAELTPYYYFKSIVGASATHPVYYWQYAGFLQALKCELPAYDDVYFSSGMLKRDETRFGELKEMDIVTNVFCDESITYSYWFGKSMLPVYFQLLREELSKELFDQMFPEKLCFWVGYAINDESYRVFSNLEIEREKNMTDPNAENDSPENDKFAYPENKSNNTFAISGFLYGKGLMDYGQYTNVDLRAKILNQAPRFLK